MVAVVPRVVPVAIAGVELEVAAVELAVLVLVVVICFAVFEEAVFVEGSAEAFAAVFALNLPTVFQVVPLLLFPKFQLPILESSLIY